MRRRGDVLRLERAGERGDGLAVAALEQLLPAALDLEQPPEVVRVQQQLLVRRVALARVERALVEAAGEALDHGQELERAERLAQERIRAGRPRRLLRLDPGARQEDDADPAGRGIALQSPGEAQAADVGKADVEHDDVRWTIRDRRHRLGAGARLGDLDVDQLEGRAEQRQEAGVIVDEEDAGAAVVGVT